MPEPQARGVPVPVTMGVTSRSYVLRAQKIVFISVPKNACTSLNWLMARLSGQDPQRFYDSLRPRPTRQQCIHNRRLWVDVPLLREVDEAERAEMSTENGWFIFGVVREPRVRAWSAWQSKLLVQNPSWTQEYSGEDWFPRLPARPEDVIEDFARFVRYLRDNPDGPVMRDRHFVPQSRILHADRIPYTRIYDVSEVPVLLEDLGKHLRGQGVEADLTLGRENDTPLGVRPEVFGAEVRADLEAIYAADLDQFGDRWDFDRVLAKQSAWPEEAFRDIGMRAALHQRIGDLSRAAEAQERRVRQFDRRAAKVSRVAGGRNQAFQETVARLKQRGMRAISARRS